MRITLTESQYKVLKEALISQLGEKVALVKKYLDANFTKADENVNGVDKPIVIQFDAHGNVISKMDDVDLFYHLQEQFQNLVGDKETRDKLLKQIITDWYSGAISNGGTLSKNL